MDTISWPLTMYSSGQAICYVEDGKQDSGHRESVRHGRSILLDAGNTRHTYPVDLSEVRLKNLQPLLAGRKTDGLARYLRLF